MKISDLQVFNDAPYYFWVKNPEGVYLWGNKLMCEYAKGKITGKTDFDLTNSTIAENLTTNDRKVLELGSSLTFHEQVITPEGDSVTLSVCKYVEELEGKTCVFGISFAIE